jgi:putative ABC transport system ATP-binding protein
MLKMKNINVRDTLKDLNLTIKKGEFVLVIGENGAGKTTLFNTISGNIRPKSGTILIDGTDVTDMPQCDRAGLVSNVFQDPKIGTISTMTLRENLNMAYLRGKSKTFAISDSSERDDLYKEKLKILNMKLEERLDDYAGDLSGGQRQALSIVMSTISDAKLLLLDEITAALDRKSSENILRIVDEIIRQEKKTCLMITHNADHVERLGNRVLFLKEGKLS